jgi:prepilin-type N-terminal cleavage/methylation domain-containing protein
MRTSYACASRDGTKRTYRHKNHVASAFTIVELLIVIVVIGILAAISIVSYTGITQNARDSSAKATAQQIATKVELSYINDGAYPSSLSSIGISDSNGTTYQYRVTSDTWCATVTVGSASYYVSDTTAAPTKGGCPGHGQGGVAAITNLAANPRATSVSLTGGMAGWRSSRWFGSSNTGTHSVVTSASDGPSGIDSYLRKKWVTVTASAGDLGFENTYDASSTAGTNGLAVSGSTQYTFSSYLRSSVAYNGAQVQVWWKNASGAYLSTVSSSRVALVAGQWTRISLTTTSPANARYVGVVSDLDSQAATVNMTLDGTGLMITEGSTLYNYADGNSNSWIWNGTANASTSTGPAL